MMSVWPTLRATFFRERSRMKIHLWFNEHLNQWRWTLSASNPNEGEIQESGNREDLRLAMNDVANTVEYLLRQG